MGRHKTNKITQKIRLPKDLAAAVDDQIREPFSQEPQYGAISRLCESLLRGWLAGRFIVAQPVKAVAICPECLEFVPRECSRENCPQKERPNETGDKGTR